MLLIISPSPASFRIRKNFPRNIFFTRRPSLLGAVLCVITQPLHRSFAWRHNEWLLRILGGPFFSRCLLFCGVRCSYSNKNQNNPASLFWLCRQCEILCAHFPAAIHAWTWALVSRPRPPPPPSLFCFLKCTQPFATLETRRKLEPKCVPQGFLG